MRVIIENSLRRTFFECASASVGDACTHLTFSFFFRRHCSSRSLDVREEREVFFLITNSGGHERVDGGIYAETVIHMKKKIA